MSEFKAARVLEAELTTGEISALTGPPTAEGYDRARVLVRLHGEPLGVVTFDTTPVTSTLIDAITMSAWRELRPQIEQHLETDGTTAASASDLASLPDCRRADITSPTGPLVTVAIPSLRNVDSTVACVRRILAGSYTNFEVVVADNDSDGSALSSAIEANFGEEARVRYVHEPRIGVSNARNKGLDEAAGEIVVFSDDDVYVDKRWLETIVAPFSDPAVACVTGSILPAEMETQSQEWLEEFGGFNKGFSRQVYDMGTNSRPQHLYPFDDGRFGSGANMAFRTEVLRSLGGFRIDLGPGTPTYGGEDIDALRRVVSAGYTLVYEPAALLWHFHRRSYTDLRRQMYRYGVGFSSLVTYWLIEPETRGAVARRLFHGFRHVFGRSSTKNKNKSDTYPTSLSFIELAGMAVGPVAYVRSRRRNRKEAS